MKCSVDRAERNECSLPDSRPVREEQGTMPPAAWEADRPVPPSYAWCLTLRSIALAGSDLRLPTNILDHRGHLLQAKLEMATDLGRGRTDHLGQPAQMRRAPSGPPLIADVLAEQKRLEPHLSSLPVSQRILPGADEVSDGFATGTAPGTACFYQDHILHLVMSLSYQSNIASDKTNKGESLPPGLSPLRGLRHTPFT